jgi:uncharacterized protein (DUF58 family)
MGVTIVLSQLIYNFAFLGDSLFVLLNPYLLMLDSLFLHNLLFFFLSLLFLTYIMGLSWLVTPGRDITFGNELSKPHLFLMSPVSITASLKSG